MKDPQTQLKGDIWQILAHALANNLLWIAAVLAIVGFAIFFVEPFRRLGKSLFLGGVTVALIALALHGVAWTRLL